MERGGKGEREGEGGYDERRVRKGWRARKEGKEK